MNQKEKIYIAGHNGMVGSAIVRKLKIEGYEDLVFRSSKELDLRNQDAVNAFFEVEKPDYVFLAAAKVGGIVANNTYRADFLYDNLMIEANVIHAAYVHKVKKLLFLGSSCIYPKFAPQPMKEDDLLTGILEPTNEPYAIAKIAGIKMCENYRRQYGCDFISAMPTNLYGLGDNYDLEKSHVIPALIRKMHLGKCLQYNDWNAIRIDLANNPIEGTNDTATNDQIINILYKYGITQCANHPTTQPPNTPTTQPPNEPTTQQANEPTTQQANHPTTQCANHPTTQCANHPTTQYANHPTTQHANTPTTQVTLWGTGSPLREFMHVDDLAAACYFLMKEYSGEQFVNVGSGEEVSIKEVAEMIKEIVGFKGDLVFDTTKPDGTPRKLMDSTRLQTNGFSARIGLQQGLTMVYDRYKGYLAT
ncbi:MAG: NAD-dependent epimerase/dehydratase family protein [Saprospiraceae bacterium]|nr:NAD-dependent epimerase/dehydratase family protein [Saprospiraceae bacterium]